MTNIMHMCNRCQAPVWQDRRFEHMLTNHYTLVPNDELDAHFGPPVEIPSSKVANE